MKPFEEVGRPKKFAELTKFHKFFVNNKYSVDVRCNEGMDGFVWLSIKRNDKNWMRDWRELQTIKNMICGPEREGCEIYPAESRLVDTSNQFHIFVLPKGDKFPFGYEGRMIVEGHKGGINKGSSQRSFKLGTKPKDCMTAEKAKELSGHYTGDAE